jgi:endogenous inhibitor of DNA gyrase (YacG/DUF329 family)
MSECLNCGKPIEAYTGRRTRKYCSSACKQAHFKKTKPKEAKYVQRETYKAALERIKLLEAQISSQGQKQPIPSKKEEVSKKHEKNDNAGIKDLTTPPIVGKTDDNWLERRKRKLGF